MRTHLRSRVLGAGLLAIALFATACGGSGEGTDADATSEPTGAATGGAPEDGPTITVGSFNFNESVILAEIYAQALEDAGYPIEKTLDVGSRELIFPSLESGEIDLLPEYVGSALAVGFQATDVPTNTEEATTQLEEEFSSMGVTVLEPAPGQDKNVFVVTQDFAEQNGVTTISDLADVEGEVTLGGPPECEERSTCYAGLQDTYGLENLSFSPIQEGSARIAALENGEIQLALLFSTQPVIKEKGFVALEEDKELIPPENIVPVVSTEVVEAYGEDFTELVNSISEKITTEVLLDLNGKVELDAEDPEDVARTWLEENGFLGS